MPEPSGNAVNESLSPYMTPERLQWLERLARFGPQEWNRKLPGNAAAHCRAAGWTRVRMTRPECHFLHELTDAGRLMLHHFLAHLRG